jgi:hypothetical protein
MILALPIKGMGNWTVIWKGFIYAIAMTFAKFVMGPLVILVDALGRRIRKRSNSLSSEPYHPGAVKKPLETHGPEGYDAENHLQQPQSEGGLVNMMFSPSSLIIGFGLVARGEMCILMAQVSHGSPAKPEILGLEVFLISIWAIIICTVAGPMLLAFVVKRTWPSVVTQPLWGMDPSDLEKWHANEGKRRSKRRSHPIKPDFITTR